MTNPRRILVVDDEPKMRRLLEMTLQGMGHAVVQAGDGQEALDLLAAEPCDLVLSDMRMPRLDGLGLLRSMRERGLETPVVMLTAHGTVESAVEAMKLGAVDYILRPFEMSTVELAVTRALAMGEVQQENRFLRGEVGRGWGEFIGQGEAMTRLYALVRQVATARSSVFIVGETGTGKELVARAIHQQSGRTGLFVPYNCAAIPADLLEGELFGSRKGAFTGADKDRVGRFEASSGGTMFLDEVTEMPIGLQGKLLRVLQEGVVERLGTQVPIALDLRVVAATNRDPALAMAEGRLRADLYYRLNVLTGRGPTPAGAARGHPPAGRAFPGPLQPRAGTASAAAGARDTGAVAHLRLARQCPRIAEPDGEGRRPGPGGHVSIRTSSRGRCWMCPRNRRHRRRHPMRRWERWASSPRWMRSSRASSARLCGAPGTTSPPPPGCWRSASGPSGTNSRSTAADRSVQTAPGARDGRNGRGQAHSSVGARCPGGAAWGAPAAAPGPRSRRWRAGPPTGAHGSNPGGPG